ncbi:hypothetical protein M9Q43_13320 [Flavobacterium sp. HXWNR29]|uniref:hypothetical protein n=1 Tax=Flavobacterium odoriferum TaxID=2946604 RepID=UPI0021CB8994|nr:hypothetical protein [Flavobacterium sp. HXWNR29]MCU4190137.1 hypothetical protein [Flavobacterium sp. HXWNR29]
MKRNLILILLSVGTLILFLFSTLITLIHEETFSEVDIRKSKTIFLEKGKYEVNLVNSKKISNYIIHLENDTVILKMSSEDRFGPTLTITIQDKSYNYIGSIIIPKSKSYQLKTINLNPKYPKIAFQKSTTRKFNFNNYPLIYSTTLVFGILLVLFIIIKYSSQKNNKNGS